MAQQTITQPKNTMKATVQRVDRDNEHSRMCRCVRMGREQHVPDSIACTQNHTSRVGVGCGAAHALPVQPTAPSPHAVKRKKTHSLTLLLQNHLDHLNILLLGVVGTSTRAVARAFARESQPSPTLQKHRSKAAEQQHGVQKYKDAFTDTAPAESP